MAIDFKTAGVHPDLVKATNEVLSGNAPEDWANIHARPHTYFHRIDVASTASPLRFFTASPADQVTNFPGPQLPNDHVFVIDSLRFIPLYGFNAAGTADADSLPFDVDGEKCAVLANEITLLLQHGHVEFRIGERLLSDTYGLQQFPAGCGPHIGGAGVNTNTTVQEWGAWALNGAPSIDNRYIFSPAQVALPSKSWRLQVDYLATITPTESITLMACVDGTLITRSGI